MKTKTKCNPVTGNCINHSKVALLLAKALKAGEYDIIGSNGGSIELKMPHTVSLSPRVKNVSVLIHIAKYPKE